MESSRLRIVVERLFMFLALSALLNITVGEGIPEFTATGFSSALWFALFLLTLSARILPVAGRRLLHRLQRLYATGEADFLSYLDRYNHHRLKGHIRQRAGYGFSISALEATRFEIDLHRLKTALKEAVKALMKCNSTRSSVPGSSITVIKN